MPLDLIDLELLIRALTKERRLLHEPAASALDEPDCAFYQTLDKGDLSDRLTRLLKFFREQKKAYAHRGVEVKLELRIASPGEEMTSEKTEFK